MKKSCASRPGVRLLATVLGASLMFGCPSSDPTPQNPPTIPPATSTPVANPTPEATATPEGTPTPGETATPEGTATPAATATPGDAATPAGTATPVGTPTPGDTATPEATSTPGAAFQHSLQPLPGAQAPKLTQKVKVKMETTAGDLMIEVYPEAAPNAAKRFVELVNMGFYDDTPIFRVVKSPRPFVAQFGVNWRGDFKNWKNSNFNDDPSYFKLDRGTLAFAKSGPNSNSTQIFFNFTDNSFLSQNGGFTTFAKVVEGDEVMDKWKSVGTPDMGLDQGKLWSNGGDYLASLPVKPDMIKKATVVK